MPKFSGLEIEEASTEDLLERAKSLLIQSEDEDSSAGSSEQTPPLLLPAVFRVAEATEVFAAPDIAHESLGTLYQGATIVVLVESN